MYILLPGEPGFDEILGTVLTPGWQQYAGQNDGSISFVTDSATGILRPANVQELREYLYGGEYDEVMTDEME